MAAVDKMVLSVEFNGAGIEALKAAVVQHYHDECLRLGLTCTRAMRDAVAAAVEAALADILTEGCKPPPEGKAVATDDVLEDELWKAWQERRMPNVRIEKGECRGKVADFIVVDDPDVPRDLEMDVVRDRIGRAMIDHLDRRIEADNSLRQETPPDGNPYSDLPLSANPCRDIPPAKLDPLRDDQRRALEAMSTSLRKPVNPPEVEQAALGVPAPNGPGLDVHERAAVVESVRQQYGDRAAQAEAGRLGALTDLGSAEIERAICVTFGEIGYPPAPGQLASLVACLTAEVVKASDISSDGCPAIGRPQAMHNLNWLLRNKFPPGKIDARKIARMGVRKFEPADTPGLPEK